MRQALVGRRHRNHLMKKCRQITEKSTSELHCSAVEQENGCHEQVRETEGQEMIVAVTPRELSESVVTEVAVGEMAGMETIA